MPCLTPARPIDVLLVDDQRAILAGVTSLIESDGPAMRVVGRAMTGRQALDLAISVQPKVILLDVYLGAEDGLALIPQFRRRCDATVIVFTCLANHRVRQRAANLGVVNLISKSAPGDELIAAILRASK